MTLSIIPVYDPPSEAELELQAMLNRMNQEHHERCKPILDQLVRFAQLKAPRYFIDVQGDLGKWPA